MFIPLYSPALSHLRQWLSKDSWCHQPSARSCNGNGFGFGSGSGSGLVFSARFSFELVAKIVSGFEINVACVGVLFTAVHSIPEIAGWDCRSRGGLLGVAYMYIWPSVVRQLTFVYYPCGGILWLGVVASSFVSWGIIIDGVCRKYWALLEKNCNCNSHRADATNLLARKNHKNMVDAWKNEHICNLNNIFTKNCLNSCKNVSVLYFGMSPAFYPASCAFQF